MRSGFISNWVIGAAFTCIVLLALSPLFLKGWSMLMALTFLCFPGYLLHQCEEHARDRFRLFFNKTIGSGREILSPLFIFLVNVPIVWGVIILSLYGAVFFSPGWSLIAAYLVLINGLTHLGHALIFRTYNPGLVTALVLFLPLGSFMLYTLHSAGEGTWANHAIGLSTSLAIHAAILMHVQQKLKRLNRKSQ